MSAGNKLFAVYLGGSAEGATLEVHDVVFAVAPDIKATVPQLKELWFGTKESVHVDSWIELSHVDGYEVSLQKTKSDETKNKLFFVNMGSYLPQRFGENHHFLFLVCENTNEAKKRAKAFMSAKGDDLPHTDNLFEVDSIKEISTIFGLHVHLKEGVETRDLKITNLYWPLKAK